MAVTAEQVKKLREETGAGMMDCKKALDATGERIVARQTRGKPLADQLWRDSGLGPADMAAAQTYDGFAPSTWYWLEAAGFCGRGEAHAFIQDGRIALDGALPVNTFGGSLSQGRLHGMGHIAEAVLQLSGRAGERQLGDPGAIAVFDGSPMLRGSGMVLTRDR